MEKVLVTGATGFIGLHCIKLLLDRGYSVNGTLRSQDRQTEVVDSLERNNTPTRHLSLFEVDLNRDSGWDSAIRDCNYVVHVASPFVLTDEDEDFFVKPADWSNPNKPVISFYAKSKSMAELAAWEFMEMEKPDFSLTVINPVLVMGPSLSKDVGTSNSLVKNMINGSVPGTPRIHIGIVDVRDVASAHILAMESSSADGERIIVSEKELWVHEVAAILRDAGFNKTPKVVFPTWLMKIVALFRKDLALMIPMIGKRRDVSSAKARELLGWRPMKAELSIIDTAQQLKDFDLL